LLSWDSILPLRDTLEPRLRASILAQVRDSMGALVARFQQLRVDGGGLNICRLGRESRKPLAIKSVVQCETFAGLGVWGVFGVWSAAGMGLLWLG
jgi:hypothetical protein